MKTNRNEMFVLVIASCFLVLATGENITNRNVIQNLTASYSSFLDDIYYHLTVTNTTEKCRLHMKEILDLSSLGNVDALKILDSTGKPSSGILEGGVYFIGYYSECVNTIVNKEKDLRGQYCLFNLNFSVFHQEVMPNPSFNVLKQSLKPPTIGLCVPLSCTEQDIKFALDASLSDNFEDTQGHISVCHTRPGGFFQDVPAILFLCLQIFLSLIAFVATYYDYSLDWRKTRAYEVQAAKSVSTELLCDQRTEKETNIKQQIFLAFSFYTNTPKILTVKSKDNISCLHGLRFLSMALIIFGHTYSFASTVLFVRNPGSASDAPQDFTTQIFANGTFAVDTFFFMSGLLVCYAGIKSLETAKEKWSWLMIFYVHRYVRIAPLMMAVVFNSAFLVRYMSSGPNWMNSIQMYDEWCRKQWWVNALFIHNLYGSDEMCLSHTWYLAADMQMYWVSPIILILLVWNLKAGLTSMGVFLFATTICTAILTAVNHYPAIPYINNVVPLDLMNAYYKNVYIKSYCRMGPFIVGMALGYYLYKKKEFNMSRIVTAIGWTLYTIGTLGIIYLMWPANQGILPTNAEAAAYSALARTAWGLCLGWLVFACFYGYGGLVNKILSWSVWVPFSRITFPAYLIHPVIMCMVYGSTESMREFAYDFLLYMFIGHICITYSLSLLLSLLYESPFVVIEKLLFSSSSKRRSQDREDTIIHKECLEDISTKK